MSKCIRALALAGAFVLARMACGQNAATLPWAEQQFFDGAGRPLAGGYIYTCTAGSSCGISTPGQPPSTPLATYTNSAGTVQNPNPVVLDSGGRASIWIGTGAGYKIVAQNSLGAAQWTVDNVLAYATGAQLTSLSSSLTAFESSLASSTGSTLAGYQASGAGAAARTVAAKLGETISVLDYGATGNGTTDDTAAFLAAAAQASATGKTLVFPAGSYLLNNSAAYITINNATGKWDFQPGAKLVFSSLNYGGLYFNTASNFVVSGAYLTYQGTWTTQLQSSATVFFNNSNNVSISNITINNTPAMGIEYFLGSNFNVDGAWISNTGKDGLHIANAKYTNVVNYTAYNTGDDSLSYVDYGPGGTYGGWHTATNINVKYSNTGGITVDGTSNLSLSNFVIDATASQGMFVGQDSNCAGHIPAGITISNGVIMNAGQRTPLTSPNPYGVYVTMNDASGTMQAKFPNLTVVNAAATGFFVDQYGATKDIEIDNVRVDTTPGQGFQFLAGTKVRIFNSIAKNTTGYGYDFNDAATFAGNITAYNVSGGGSPNRAVWVDASPILVMDGVHVYDDRNPALGYVVGEAGGNTGVISDVDAYLPNGTLSISSLSNTVLVQAKNYNSAASYVSGNQSTLALWQNKGTLTAQLATTGSSVDNAALLLGPQAGSSATGTVLAVVDNSGNQQKVLYVDKAQRVLIGTSADNGADLLQVNGTLNLAPIKANSGTRYLCINSSGQVVSQTTACSGT